MDLPLAFALGGCAWLFRDRLPIHRGLAIGALAALIVAMRTGTYVATGILFVAYLTLYLAVTIRHAIHTDLSYGVYIYAFPLQQLAAAFGLHALGFAPFLAVSVAGALARPG